MTEQDTDNRLVRAYNSMMHTIRDVLETADEESSDVPLQQALLKARDNVVELGELTAEEAAEVGEYIKRDINDAAEYLMESSAEFSDWLMLDIEVVERKVIDLFLSVADRTRVELEQLKELNRTNANYYTGEITGPGTLECTQCKTHSAYATTGIIYKCPNCGHNEFKRPAIKRLSD